MAKVWTDERLNRLREKYGVISDEELARELGVSLASLTKKAKELRLQRKTAKEAEAPRQTAARADGAILGGEKVVTIDGQEEEMIPSGLYIFTEEGWKPVMVRKSRIAPR
ncbi:MAG: hypothetical protein ONB30_08625 [candidate division KSB1 bacterium]|nr:hypothetical protein [candidate division KSB1 bacterium]